MGYSAKVIIGDSLESRTEIYLVWTPDGWKVEGDRDQEIEVFPTIPAVMERLSFLMAQLTPIIAMGFVVRAVSIWFTKAFEDEVPF